MFRKRVSRCPRGPAALWGGVQGEPPPHRPLPLGAGGAHTDTAVLPAEL